MTEKDFGIHLHTWPGDFMSDHQGPTTQQGTFPMNWQVSLWSRSSQWFEDPGYQNWTQIYPTGELPIPRLAQPQPTLSTYWTLFPLSAKRVWLKVLVCPSGINPMGILLKAAWEKEEEVLLSWSEKQAEQRGTDVSPMRQVTKWPGPAFLSPFLGPGPAIGPCLEQFLKGGSLGKWQDFEFERNILVLITSNYFKEIWSKKEGF